MNIIENQWQLDKNILPLFDNQKSMYFNAQSSHFQANNCLFNIQNPKTLNDKIQWTKFFDQKEDTIRCTDKLGVKSYVKEKLGIDAYAKTLWESESIINFRQCDLPNKFVLKTNNDSGTTFVIQEKSKTNFQNILHKCYQTLNSTYGQIYGEWSYSKIKPKIFAEEYIDDLQYLHAADYKFFCGGGEVFFCHYIYDRGSGKASEQIIDIKGRQIDFYLDPNFKKGKGFNIPKNWEKMVEIASELSKDFKLVRVDLYTNQNKVYVGEMTFWPYGGIYKGEDQKKISELIKFDNSTFLKPLI
jgi:hypothetical protein